MPQRIPDAYCQERKPVSQVLSDFSDAAYLRVDDRVVLVPLAFCSRWIRRMCWAQAHELYDIGVLTEEEYRKSVDELGSMFETEPEAAEITFTEGEILEAALADDVEVDPRVKQADRRLSRLLDGDDLPN